LNQKDYENTNFVKNIRPRNDKQAFYLESMKEFPVTIGIGHAGTGKSFLAVYRATKEFEANKINKLVLVRPHVATENLGFLPGTLEEKMDPYMRPLFDALQSRWGPKKVDKMISTGEIEIAPLAFMRGRTLNNCAVIFDEAQNSTVDQMKMFLTRFGENIKVMINGDPTQSDIVGSDNGLVWAVSKLRECSSVNIVGFSETDVVRSELVKDILKYLN